MVECCQLPGPVMVTTRLLFTGQMLTSHPVNHLSISNWTYERRTFRWAWGKHHWQITRLFTRFFLWNQLPLPQNTTKKMWKSFLFHQILLFETQTLIFCKLDILRPAVECWPQKDSKADPPVTIKTVLAGQESFFLRFTRNILTPFGDNIVNIKQSGGLMRPRYW